MRAPLAVIVLALCGALGLFTWAFLYRMPAPAPVHYLASTKPAEAAVERSADAVDVPLAEDLVKRPGVDWPVFLGPTGDGKSPEKGLRPWPSEGPRIVWEC